MEQFTPPPGEAAVAACLALALGLPALAAHVEPAYTLLYRASPAAAQYLQPVRESADVYLLGPESEKTFCDFLGCFREGEGENRVDYMEYVFSGTPGALADCRLAGDFYTAGLLTEGSWKVTFRLEGGA